MFMSKGQLLLHRLKGEEMSTERFRVLPQATQQPQLQRLLFKQSGIIHPSSLLASCTEHSWGPGLDLGPSDIEEEDRSLPSEVRGTAREKGTIAILMPGIEKAMVYFRKPK